MTDVNAKSESRKGPTLFDSKNALFRFGLCATTIWVVAAIVFLWRFGNWQQQLKATEWADVFAGVAAPVAFLWLVLGFLQQGHELKLSSDALRLQAEELRNAVAHQKDLVAVTREQVETAHRQEMIEQAERHRLSQPRFVLSGQGGSGGPEGIRLAIRLHNLGEAATEVSVTFAQGGIFNFPMVARGEERTINLFSQTHFAPENPVSIGYKDSNGLRGAVAFLAFIQGSQIRFESRQQT